MKRPLLEALSHIYNSTRDYIALERKRIFLKNEMSFAQGSFPGQWTSNLLAGNNSQLFLFEGAKEGLTLEPKRIHKNEQLIVGKYGRDLYEYLCHQTNIESGDTLIISTRTPYPILNSPSVPCTIINLERINNIRFINKFFEAVNSKLANGDTFIGCVETFSARKNKSFIGKIPFVRTLYFGFEFLFKRIFPKVRGLKKIYFFFTKGKNRLLSKAEGLGRLVSCGFEIQDYRTIDNLLFFVVKKVKLPAFDMKPSYGLLYKMPRMGKYGKTIGVYKLRTMHPYAEYLQDYILKHNGYAETGKPANDFRLTPWGKFMRKYWLDELPQLINVLKGELKLVGVRPISKRYFLDIPIPLQKLRIKHKPGCIPPYVALNRKSSVESVLAAESEYLEEKTKHPYTTDLNYFCRAIVNIIFKRKRSA